MLILISYALELGHLFYRVKHGVLVGRPPIPRASSLGLLWAGRAAACSSSVIVVVAAEFFGEEERASEREREDLRILQKVF
jgi:hypothetical protein